MLGIEFGDDADKELNLGQVKDIIYGIDNEERNLLERYQAVKEKIPEECFLSKKFELFYDIIEMLQKCQKMAIRSTKGNGN